MTDTIATIRRRVAAKISRMAPEEARRVVEVISKRDQPGKGATIFHPEIKALTGGYVSQSINFQVLRRLGIRAGIIRNRK